MNFKVRFQAVRDFISSPAFWVGLCSGLIVGTCFGFVLGKVTHLASIIICLASGFLVNHICEKNKNRKRGGKTFLRMITSEGLISLEGQVPNTKSNKNAIFEINPEAALSSKIDQKIKQENTE